MFLELGQYVQIISNSTAFYVANPSSGLVAPVVIRPDSPMTSSGTHSQLGPNKEDTGSNAICATFPHPGLETV